MNMFQLTRYLVLIIILYVELDKQLTSTGRSVQDHE